MRDEEYNEVMLEAYRDILSKILHGMTRMQIHEYIMEQISFHQRWLDES